MGGMISGPKAPPPPPPPPPPIPVQDVSATADAKRKAVAQQQQRGGVAATTLSDTLGGQYVWPSSSSNAT